MRAQAVRWPVTSADLRGMLGARLNPRSHCICLPLAPAALAPVPKGVDEFGQAQDDGRIALLRQLISIVPEIWRWLAGRRRGWCQVEREW
jgi:hypothetical protein